MKGTTARIAGDDPAWAFSDADVASYRLVRRHTDKD
jgi:hypothetical protein